MRLYEFTDPTKYLTPETDSADVLGQGKAIKEDDSSDIANRRLRKNPETKKLSDTL
jgi:hypothetical protein